MHGLFRAPGHRGSALLLAAHTIQLSLAPQSGTTTPASLLAWAQRAAQRTVSWCCTLSADAVGAHMPAPTAAALLRTAAAAAWPCRSA